MPTPNYTALLSQALIDYAGNKTGLYNALRSIHHTAYLAGDTIVYPANMTFEIQVTLDNQNNPQHIELPPVTDFNNCTFKVTNTTVKAVTLFILSTPFASLQDVGINKEELIAGQPLSVLDDDPTLLIVTDNNVWTTRTEYDALGNPQVSPFKRKDILYVENHIVQNDPIATYNNNASNPICQYIKVTTGLKQVKNLKFIRESASTSLTNLLSINKQYNVKVENVEVFTPQQPETGGIYGDQCIGVYNSAKIEMTNIVFHNTYSSIYNWGYGFNMINVWNSKFTNLYAIEAAKGIFGCEDINALTVLNSQLNRVDVHCYGRNITCVNCTFKNSLNDFHIYNRFSSFYGTLRFNQCNFDRFLPVRIDSDYNAFTPFDLIMENCYLKVLVSYNDDGSLRARFNCLVDIPSIGAANPRPELQQKCLPNFNVSNLNLYVPSDVPNMCFLKIDSKTYTGNFYYMDTMIIDVYPYYQETPSPIPIYDTLNYAIQLVEPLTASFSRAAYSTIHNITGGS